MTTAAAGVIARAKELFRESIANTTAFRTWDGYSWSVAQARERIYYDCLPPPPLKAISHSLADLQALRPFAILYKPAAVGVTLEHVANGGHNGFLPRGVLVARFERDVPASQLSDPGEADRAFENFMGQLIMSGDVNNPGLVELSGKAGYLNITRFDDIGPYRAEPDDVPTLGDCQRYSLQVEWGVRM